MSPFSPKRGIFGTAHAWIFRISWETQRKFTNIVAGAPRVSSSGLGRFLQGVFLTYTTLVFVSMAFLISQSGLLFIVTQYHVYLKCISQLTTLVFVSMAFLISQLTTQVFVSMAFLISQSSLLFIVTQYHGNKYGGANCNHLWTFETYFCFDCSAPQHLVWFPGPLADGSQAETLSTQHPSSLLLDFMAILDNAVFSENDFFRFTILIVHCTEAPRDEFLLT